MAQCGAISNPDSIWPHFCPSLPAAYLYAVLFGLITLTHFIQMIVHRKPYSWVIAFSAGLQTATYVLRILSINDPTQDWSYSGWFILMMIAPIWTNAYAYMVMGRMVYNFTPTASVFKIKAWRFGLIFVLLDVLAFFVQAGGASIASGTGKNLSTIMLGIHVYMAGIGFQQLCIFAFLFLAIRFHKKLLLQTKNPHALQLLYTEYAVVGLITIRIIFRMIEYSNGIKSSIPKHEVYQYIFDSTLMLIALVLFNIFHPGRLMPGTESNLPSRKTRKGWKKSGMKPTGRGEGLLPTYQAPLDAVAMEDRPAAYGYGGYARVMSPSPRPSADGSEVDDMGGKVLCPGYLSPGRV